MGATPRCVAPGRSLPAHPCGYVFNTHGRLGHSSFVMERGDLSLSLSLSLSLFAPLVKERKQKILPLDPYHWLVIENWTKCAVNHRALLLSFFPIRILRHCCTTQFDRDRLVFSDCASIDGNISHSTGPVFPAPSSRAKKTEVNLKLAGSFLLDGR